MPLLVCTEWKQRHFILVEDDIGVEAIAAQDRSAGNGFTLIMSVGLCAGASVCFTNVDYVPRVSLVGCTEQCHVPHGGWYKIFFPPFSIILKLCIRGEDAFTPYTRSVTLILVSFLS